MTSKPEIEGDDADRRFAIEELSNGRLVKITKSGSGRFVGRYAFQTLPDMLDFLKVALGPDSGGGAR